MCRALYDAIVVEKKPHLQVCSESPLSPIPRKNYITYGAFTLDVKSVFSKNLGGILGGTQC
jgi:hypothetical protein